jgi:hypothetical protein
MHAPLVQRSLAVGLHTEQVMLVVPHWFTLFVIWQTPLRQQPPPQLVLVHPEHCPCAVQDCPIGQFEHMTPLKPHAAPASPFSQTPPSVEQQPLQLCGSHSHWPPTHR